MNYAHNAFLDLLLDFGLIGAVPVAAWYRLHLGVSFLPWCQHRSRSAIPWVLFRRSLGTAVVLPVARSRIADSLPPPPTCLLWIAGGVLLGRVTTEGRRSGSDITSLRLTESRVTVAPAERRAREHANADQPRWMECKYVRYHWIFRSNLRPGPEWEASLQKAVRALHHRGPDAGGVWLDDGVGLGHRRLSILDLTERGRQPMASGRYALVYNGEVYNYRDVRRELESAGRLFTSSGDSELVLAAIETWGVEAAVRRFIGMFAPGGVGQGRAAAAADSRSPRRQAAVLRLGWDVAVVRLGAQGPLQRNRPLAAGNRSERARRLLSATGTSTHHARSTVMSSSWSPATGWN